MASLLTKKPVHWVDGMKISRQHFYETEHFIHDSLRDTASNLNSAFSFGLLSTSTDGSRSFDAQIFCDFSQQINIKIAQCRAVTADGYRIELIDSTDFSLNSSFKDIMNEYKLTTDRDQTLYVVVSVNPFERQPIGQPAIHEMPPRQPYTQPSYFLYLIPADFIQSKTFGGGHLIVGKIKFQNGDLRADPKFIPASMAITSTPLLIEWYQKFGQLLGEIETN